MSEMPTEKTISKPCYLFSDDSLYFPLAVFIYFIFWNFKELAPVTAVSKYNYKINLNSHRDNFGYITFYMA